MHPTFFAVCRRGTQACFAVAAVWLSGCTAAPEKPTLSEIRAVDPQPASNGAFTWIRQLVGSAHDAPLDVSTHSSGVAVAGYFQQRVALGGEILSQGSQSVAGFHDGYVARYDNLGNHLWSTALHGSGDDYGRAVALDAAGNSYVAGSFTETLIVGDMSFVSAGGSDSFVIAFDPEGEVLWAKQHGGAADEQALDIAINPSGLVVVVGGGTQAFIVAFNSDGGRAWEQNLASSGPAAINSISLPGDDEILIAGHYEGSLTWHDQSYAGAGGSDALVAKLTAVGDLQWARSLGGESQDSLNAITTAPDGAHYAVGSFASKSLAAGKHQLTSSGQQDVLLLRVTPDGEVVWAQRAGGASFDLGAGVAWHNDGQLVVTGGFETQLQFGGQTPTSGDSNMDGFVAYYSPDGEELSASAYGSEGWDAVSGATSNGDSVFVIGEFWHTVDFDGVDLSSFGSSDGFLIRL